MTTDKLNPCPFCGRDGRSTSYMKDGLLWGYYVACENCKAHTYVCACEKPAAEDWNTGYVVQKVY